MSTATKAPENHTLYEIVDEVRSLADRIEESGGELTPEIEADLDRWEGALEIKAERIIAYYRDTESLAERAKEESKRLAALARTYNNRADSLKGLLEMQLRRLNRRDVDTPVGKAWMQKNAPSCTVRVHPELVPEDFRTLVPAEWKVDKRAILNAAKEGVDVSEFATIDQTESVRIL